jgi:cell fate (sporulation/competence/biofilm development) regulator YlbF (YheA/YmcA/DUF963 family)
MQDKDTGKCRTRRQDAGKRCRMQDEDNRETQESKTRMQEEDRLTRWMQREDKLENSLIGVPSTISHACSSACSSLVSPWSLRICIQLSPIAV